MGQVVVVGIETLIFFAIGFFDICLYIILLMVYGHLSHSLLRLKSVARSPVLSIFTETITDSGLSTICSFHLEGVWREKFYKADED